MQHSSLSPTPPVAKAIEILVTCVYSILPLEPTLPAEAVAQTFVTYGTQAFNQRLLISRLPKCLSRTTFTSSNHASCYVGCRNACHIQHSPLEPSLPAKPASEILMFMYLVSTCMPGVSYRRRLKSLLLCLWDVFRAFALSNSLVRL